jgi:uncharacterized membrane protein YsdA (DUF1294 family)
MRFKGTIAEWNDDRGFGAVIVTVLAVIGRVPWWVFPWYLLLSVLTFVLYGWDKVSARGGHWRTQESTLNGLTMLGGWPGAWIAQRAATAAIGDG